MSAVLWKLLVVWWVRSCVGLSSSQQRVSLRMSTSVTTLPPALSKIVSGLKSLPDDKYRYKQLLFWAGSAPAMDAKLQTPENKVPGCLSTVYVSARLEDDGTVIYEGDSDAQLTKGLVALLVKGLSGSKPEDIAKIDPSFIKDAGITASLTPGRNNGFLNMLKVMKQKANDLQAPTEDISQENHLGPIGREMLEKLAVLKPTSIHLEDESSKHAGHAGMNGVEANESHFKLTIEADCFNDLSRVKRHKLIYTVLGEDIMANIHALQIHAQPPAQ